MTTAAQVAAAFAASRSARCHNAYTDGYTYWLHGNPIAVRLRPTILRIQWWGHHTRTTANHLNAILAAFHIPARVSYLRPDTLDFTLSLDNL